MFTRKITICHLFGFAVTIDATWVLLATLVTWSLAQGVFPNHHPGFSPWTYWIMGIGGAIGLFLCIVLHEMGHAMVARQSGIPIKDITLFIFGGVAEMEEEPRTARSELLMAIAGPLTSIALGGMLLGVKKVGAVFVWEPVQPIFIVAGYLAWLNMVLAVFNMLPAFPLDGGRVLRALLWAWKRNLRWATEIAANFGSAFGVSLLMLGALVFISGNIIGGMWWFMIGTFMRSAALMSYRNVLVRRALEGESLQRFMRTEPVTVRRDLSIGDLVEDYVYHYHHKMFPVAEEGQVFGCVSTREIKDVPRMEWNNRTVGDIMTPCTSANSVSPHEDPMRTLAIMNTTGNRRLVVVEKGRLAGIVTLKDLLHFLSLKIDLEGHTDLPDSEVASASKRPPEPPPLPSEVEDDVEEVEALGHPPSRV